MKPKVIYEEKYKRGAMVIKERSFPELKHTNGAQVVAAELLSAGRLDNGREFQVIRCELAWLEDK